MLEIYSRRGRVQVPAKVGGIIPGHVFIPFHYGYFDEHERPTAANELTISAWDAVSKQPCFKIAAVNMCKANAPLPIKKTLQEAVGHTADQALEAADKLIGSVHPSRRRIGDIINQSVQGHHAFAEACDETAQRYFEEIDFQQLAKKLADFSKQCIEHLAPFQRKYAGSKSDQAEELKQTLLPLRAGPYGLLLDFQGLYLLALFAHTSTLMIEKAARALRDEELTTACAEVLPLCERQEAALKTNLQHRSSNILAIKW